MGSRIPEGPSKAEIKKSEQEQERRLRFEDEKRKYLTEVGAYEIMTQTSLDRRNQSLEYQEGSGMPPIESLYVPNKFEPTIDFDRSLIGEYDWMEAENLGFAGYNAQNLENLREFNTRYYTALQGSDWVPEDQRNRQSGGIGGQLGMGYLAINRYRNQDLSSTDIAEGKFNRPTGLMNQQIVDYLNRTYGTNYTRDYGRVK